jgi:transposase
VIIIGVDPHKHSHTACAVQARTGELVAELTVPADADGHVRLLRWARAHGDVLLFALGDCRHVSANLERLLLARGEEVVRVPPHVAAGVRKRGRQRGKSDGVDALAVARAALQEPDLPRARLAGVERQVRMLVDHREDLVAERRRHQMRLRWHLHELQAPARIPPSGLSRPKWTSHLTDWLADREGLQARLARELLGRIGALTKDIAGLDREIAGLVTPLAGPLLAIPGCGSLTAAKPIGEIGDVRRFATDAKLAMHAGLAPIPASSGIRHRHRLNRHGNRQINAALHRIAVNQGRWNPPTRHYLARREAGGDSRKEAVRALKRHLASVVFRAMRSMAATDVGVSPVATP